MEIKDYNIIIDGSIFLDQSIKNDSRTFDNIRKGVTGQDDDHTHGCLLDYCIL